MNHKYYYDPTTHQCFDSCKDIPGKEFAEEESGNTGIYQCLSACTSYHDYDSNICLDKCGSGNKNYLYHDDSSTSSSPKICYPSCSVIPGGGYKFELKDSTNGDITCHKTQPTTPANSCDYYYLKNDGIFKCLSGLSECTDMKFKYLYGSECRNECKDYYTLEDDTASTPSQFKRCFTKTECLTPTSSSGPGGQYFNLEEKKCWINYPGNGYYINNPSPNYELVKECEKYYYTDSSKYYCIDKCISTSSTKFFVSGIKKCESSCTSFNKYYYDPTTKECFSSCENVPGKEFADEITNYAASDPDYPTVPTKPCKDACDIGQFYNDGTKIKSQKI